MQATNFVLTNPLNIIYRTENVGVNAFPTATAKTIVVSALPLGLYIMTFSLHITNPNASLTASFTRMIFQLTSSQGFDFFNETDYHTFIIPVATPTQFSRTCIVNNPGTYNFTLSITPTYTGATNVTYGSGVGASSSPSPRTFLQFTKIG